MADAWGGSWGVAWGISWGFTPASSGSTGGGGSGYRRVPEHEVERERAHVKRRRGRKEELETVDAKRLADAWNKANGIPEPVSAIVGTDMSPAQTLALIAKLRAAQEQEEIAIALLLSS